MTEHSNHFLATGTKIAEYRIESLLGEGGFGLTYLAFDENLQKRVAIKEYLPVDFAVRATDATVYPRTESTKEAFEWGLNAFINEARTLARFQNPYIVQVYRYFDANGTAYIVMEYVEGKTLRKMIKEQGRLDQRALMPLLLPILDGLSDVHNAEILHRDIKPDNILIRNNGQPVLIDFGAARQALGAKSRSITTIITPGYAPIEQYSSKSKVGPWSDIYALGAVAYYCLTQIKPEDASDRVVGDHLKPLEEVAPNQGSPIFLQAIDTALAVAPTDRPQTLEEWADMLAAGEDWEPSQSKTASDENDDKTRKADADGTRLMSASAIQAADSDQTATLARPADNKGAVKAQPGKQSHKQSKQESGNQGDGNGRSFWPWALGVVCVAIAAVVVVGYGGRAVFLLPDFIAGFLQTSKQSDGTDSLVPDQVVPEKSEQVPDPVTEPVREDEPVKPDPPVPEYALTVTTEPDNAEIILADTQEPYVRGMRLPEGEYALQISKKGFKSVSTTIRIVDKAVSKHFALESVISREEQVAYEQGHNSGKIEDLKAYLRQFPNGSYVSQVQSLLNEALRQEAIREEARKEQQRLEQERLQQERLEQQRREEEQKLLAQQQKWRQCKQLSNRAAALTGRVYVDTGNTGSNFRIKLGRFTVQPNAIRRVGASDPFRNLCSTSNCYEIRGSFGWQEYTYITNGAVADQGKACFYYFEEKPHVIRIQ
ncbi:protein kinase domain-containing protein [Hahella ganghwensis]|uniref:protein kinase domain-containing protein n=1 Tax=Hahella ganghwensis TaxID=286420 RepID=UPI0003779FCC|nr:protein kinase [Hahella ganghwensis]